MFVRDRMNPDPVRGNPEMSAIEAKELMAEQGIQHLPIVDSTNQLVGLITESSLLKSLPSDVKSFSKFEVSYILSRIKVKSIMIKDIITIDPDIPIEDAAYVLADKRIATMPVVIDGKLSGMISDKEIYLAMTSLLGFRNPGIRVTVQQPDQSGLVARLTTAIAKKGGYLSVCVGYPSDTQENKWISVCKVENIDEDELLKVISGLEDAEILDIRHYQESR
jgi:acetoin utilization protein AcuB